MAHNPDGGYDLEPNEVRFLHRDIQNMRMVQGSFTQRTGSRPEQGKPERERLTQFVEEREKQVEWMTPHRHLEIALSPREK
jgi:hypothetical protein